MVLGKLLVPGLPTIWFTVRQGPTALAVGAGGGCLDIFILVYPFSPLSPSLWEAARYRLKYCLKGPLNPKQPTNQPISGWGDREVRRCWVTFQCRGVRLIWIIVVQGLIELAVGAGVVWTFFLMSIFSLFYLPLWEGGGAMVLGKLSVPGRPTILVTVGQGPIALAVGAGGGGLDIFTLIYPFSSFSLSLGDGPI